MVFLTSKRKTIYSQNFDIKKFQNTTSIYVFWHGRMTLMYFLRPKNKRTNQPLFKNDCALWVNDSGYYPYYIPYDSYYTNNLT